MTFLSVVVKRDAEARTGVTSHLEPLGLGLCTTSGGLVSESHSFLQWQSAAQFLTNVRFKTQESNQALHTHTHTHTHKDGKKEDRFLRAS